MRYASLWPNDLPRRWRPRPCRPQRAPRHRRLQDRRSQADILGTAYALAGMAGAAAPRGGTCRRNRRHRQRRSAPARNPGRNCWRARISKARTTRAGSMGRSASIYALEAARVINPDPNAQRRRRSRSMVRRGRPFRQFPRQPVLCRRRHRSGHRRRARPQQRPNHARRAARGRPCRPAARHRPNAAAISDISKPISSRARRSKAAR